ncbi:MAG: P-II family nitrogen regulator [Phycisphaerales bacterium]|nr:P-II family nitrogen regulator [Phycisphaerales bacterium]
MKEIKAFIRPICLDKVLHAMHEHPEFPGVTVLKVRGMGRVVGRDSGDSIAFGAVEMIKIECLVRDDQCDEVVAVIQEHAHTGRPGDGKITVVTLDKVIRIRTGESGVNAI